MVCRSITQTKQGIPNGPTDAALRLCPPTQILQSHAVKFSGHPSPSTHAHAGLIEYISKQARKGTVSQQVMQTHTVDKMRGSWQ